MYVLLVLSSLIPYGFCAAVEMDMANMLMNSIPPEIDLDPLETTTYIPAIGSNVPVIIEQMVAGVAHGDFELEFTDSVLAITFDQLVITLNPYSVPKPVVNITVNDCSYDVSGSMIFKNARIELPNGGRRCVYETAAFTLESLKNHVKIQPRDSCPKANAMIGIVDHIPFWAAKPYIEKLAEQTIVKAFNDLQMSIGSKKFKVCVDYSSDELDLVLKLIR
eukprot:151986_1